MQILVTPNNDKQGILENTLALCDKLHEYGGKVMMVSSDCETYPGAWDVQGEDVSELTKACDTEALFAARLFYKKEVLGCLNTSSNVYC